MELPPVLITGATAGIGAAVVELLAESGVRVVGCGRSAATSDDGTVRLVEADVTVAEDRGRVARAAAEERVGVVVHAAGSCVRGATGNLSEAQLRAMVDLNLFAPMLLTSELMPTLRETGGTVAVLSSLAGRIGSPGNAGYSASKFGVDGWAEAAAYEFAHVGVRTRVLIPLYAATGFMVAAAVVEPAPRGPYVSFERATRARLDRSLEGAPNAGEPALQIIEALESARREGAPWFDRIVLGHTPALLRAHDLGAAAWFNEFRSQLEPFFDAV